jgi:hypothetical protein
MGLLGGLGDLVSGVTGGITGLLGAHGSKQATKQARTGVEAAMGYTQEGMDKSVEALQNSYDTQTELMSPYIQLGNTGISGYEKSVLGYDPRPFHYYGTVQTSVKDPKYSLNSLPSVNGSLDGLPQVNTSLGNLPGIDNSLGNTPNIDNSLGSLPRFSFDASQLGSTDSYNFRLNQGLQAVDRQMAASGYKLSGNRVAGLTDYAQGLASTEYENEYNRQFGEYQDKYTTALGENQLGYNRQVDTYDRAMNANQTLYNRQVDTYGRSRDENQTAYNRQMDVYGIGLNENQLGYQRQTDTFNRALGVNELGYNRDIDLQNLNYGRQTDAYTRALNEYDMVRQNQLQQIQNYQGLANLGYTAAGGLSNASGTLGANLSNLYTGGYDTLAAQRADIGQINASGKLGTWGSIGGSLQSIGDSLGSFFGL